MDALSAAGTGKPPSAAPVVGVEAAGIQMEEGVEVETATDGRVCVEAAVLVCAAAALPTAKFPKRKQYGHLKHRAIGRKNTPVPRLGH